MNIDWNWFFSAFSQCSAALIGIIAAFTISKLLSEGEKVDDYSNSISEMQFYRMDLLRKIESRKFDWYDRMNIEYSSDLRESIKNGEFDYLSEEDALSRLFEIETNLFGVENCYSYLSKKIKEIKSNMNQSISGALGIDFSALELPEIPPPNLWNNLSKELDLINNLKLEAIKLIDRFKSNKAELVSRIKNIKPIKTIIYVLIFGMLTTVIYPLHFMPLGSKESPNISFSYDTFVNILLSTKGALLSLLGLTIIGLFAYFLSIIKRIETQYIQLNESIGTEHLTLSEYSTYFQN